MTISDVVFSSQSVEWATPDAVFMDLDREFGGFNLDPCATPGNARCDTYYTLDDGWSGLAKPWEGKVFVNPPYGRRIGEWVKKAYESSLVGAMVVCLLPSRTDTAWWHDYVMKATEVRYIRGRLKFGDSTENAPFPSAIVVFGTSP